MACIDPDGTMTITARFLLKNLDQQPLSPEDIAVRLGERLFKVRGNLRELSDSEYIREDGGLYHLTDKGKEALG